jgi:hypothetical protein
LHVACIFVLNNYIYKPIATKLTVLENHRTDEDFENALVLKRYAAYFVPDARVTIFADSSSRPSTPTSPSSISPLANAANHCCSGS